MLVGPFHSRSLLIALFTIPLLAFMQPVGVRAVAAIS
jgi:hypothetical protein